MDQGPSERHAALPYLRIKRCQNGRISLWLWRDSEEREREMIHSSVRMESISLRDGQQKLLLLISLGFFLQPKDHCGRLNEPRKREARDAPSCLCAYNGADILMIIQIRCRDTAQRRPAAKESRRSLIEKVDGWTCRLTKKAGNVGACPRFRSRSLLLSFSCISLRLFLLAALGGSGNAAVI